MPARGIAVLLVGNSANDGAALADYLRKRGCDICFAGSHKDALEFLQRRRFDLVLSDFLLLGGTAYQLIPALCGTHTTMFFSFAVEEGCWWMNAIYEGQDRSDEPGMRTAQFKVILDELLFEKRLRNAEERRDKPGADRSGSLAAQARDK